MSPLTVALTLALVTLSPATDIPPTFLFPVPTPDCPLGYRESMLALYNEARAEQGHPPLLLCPSLSATALDYIHQVIAANGDWGVSTQSIAHNGYSRQWSGPNLGVLPEQLTRDLYTNLTYKSSTWSEEELTAATAIGFGCRTTTKPNVQKLYISVFFDNLNPTTKPPPSCPTTRPPCPVPSPVPTATPCPPPPPCPSAAPTTSCPSPRQTFLRISLPTQHCPTAFSGAIYSRLNRQRQANKLEHFLITPALTEAVYGWLNTANQSDQEFKLNESTFGQLTWRKLWDARLVDSFEVDPEEPFTEKWNSKLSLPWFTGNGSTGGSPFTMVEWSAVKSIGIGCTMNRGRGRQQSSMVTLRLAVFFGKGEKDHVARNLL